MPENNRGVWTMHGRGPSGEPIVEVIDSQGRQLLTGAIPHGMNPGAFVEALYRLLDVVDLHVPAIPAQPPIANRVRARSARATSALALVPANATSHPGGTNA